MTKKTTPETQQLIEQLYAQDLPIAEISRRANVSYATAYGYTKARQNGFASLVDYQEHLARESGFTSRTKYQEHLARESGFTSRSEYEEYLAGKRQQLPANRKLSVLIKKRLDKLDKTQKWLAEQLGIAGGTVSRYASGKNVPNEKLQKRLFEVLELQYKTLDDLLE